MAAAKLELGAARTAPRLERPPTGDGRPAGTCRLLLVTGDWMAPKQLHLLAPTISINPCSLPVSCLGKHDWQGLPSPLGLRCVVVGRQGFRGTGRLLKVRRSGTYMLAWMTFDCRPGVLQYLANLITAT